MKTILLIEDNEMILSNMAEILELSGYQTIQTKDGREGVTAAFKTTPDLIICDIMMPELDGYGVIHLLQKNPSTQHIPFIFLTAKAERTEIRKGMELGADDYITKPFSAAELLQAVETRLRKAAQKFTVSGVESQPKKEEDSNSLLSIVADGETHRYKKKQIIYAEGNQAYQVYYLNKGKVKAYRINNEGKELIVNLYGKGDFFGYLPILEGGVHQESAEVLEEAELTVVSKHKFEEVMNGNKEEMKKFIQLLANNVSEREAQLIALAYNSLRKKVASSILSIYKKYPVEGSERSITISREDLAKIAGTATESVIRTLSDFKEEQLIEIKSGSIIILQEKRLRDMLN